MTMLVGVYIKRGPFAKWTYKIMASYLEIKTFSLVARFVMFNTIILRKEEANLTPERKGSSLAYKNYSY